MFQTWSPILVPKIASDLRAHLRRNLNPEMLGSNVGPKSRARISSANLVPWDLWTVGPSGHGTCHGAMEPGTMEQDLVPETRTQDHVTRYQGQGTRYRTVARDWDQDWHQRPGARTEGRDHGLEPGPGVRDRDPDQGLRVGTRDRHQRPGTGSRYQDPGARPGTRARDQGYSELRKCIRTL